MPPESPEEILYLIKQPKLIYYPMADPVVANHTKYLCVSSDLLDSSGAIIPRLQLQIEWKNGGIECNEKYTLFYFDERWRRVFQIEVYSKSKLSHRDGEEKWYGPHLHYNGQNRRCSACLCML